MERLNKSALQLEQDFRHGCPAELDNHSACNHIFKTHFI